MAMATPTLTSSTGRTWLGALGALVVIGSLGWTTGPLGFLIGGVIAGLWYLLPGAYALALGHVLAIPVVPDPTLGVVLALETGFIGIIAAPIVDNRAWPIGLGVVIGMAFLLGVIAWTGWHAWDTRWLAGLAVLILSGVALYGLHRYAVVSLELAGVEHVT